MEDTPPGYEHIDPDILDILPPYLSTSSLVNLCLVSRAYYRALIPYLWGNPAAHFVAFDPNDGGKNSASFSTLSTATAAQNDQVYIALTRFKRTLRIARPSTRALCHTLHLPPAQSEIYGGPNASWVRDVLEYLPSLQSLCVSGLPFFDHNSLFYAARPISQSPAALVLRPDYHSLKLLLAASEPNITSSSLSAFLPLLPSLVYLDLSYTTAAREATVLSSLRGLRHLRVLKLRGIGLRDSEAEILTNAIGLHVRLLDIAQNNLSDRIVKALLQSCFPADTQRSQNGQTVANTHAHAYSSRVRQLESWPIGIPPPADMLSLQTLQTVDLDTALVGQLTKPLTGRLAFEDIPDGGLTHLHISGNANVSFQGITEILSTGRMHVIDAGDIGGVSFDRLQQLIKQHNNTVSQPHASRQQILNDILGRQISGLKPAKQSGDMRSTAEIEGASLSNAESLLPLLETKVGHNLTYLRISHTLVTSGLPSKSSESPEFTDTSAPSISATHTTELPGSDRAVFEMIGSKSYAAELPSGPLVYELDATPAPQRCELPGDPIFIAISPAIGDFPGSDSPSHSSSSIRREGANAPEVYQGNSHATADSVKTTTSPEIVPNIRSQPRNPVQDQAASLPSSQVGHTFGSKSSDRLRTIIDLKLEAELAWPVRSARRLQPSHLPHLTTLALTKLPPMIDSVPFSLIDRLKDFISACGFEAYLARAKAHKDYSLPPGRARRQAEAAKARALFALQCIILEVAEDKSQIVQNWKKASMSKSSTGDMDSENLWSAAEDDFSFFDEEGEAVDECGIYDNEPPKHFATASNDLIVISASESQPRKVSASQSSTYDSVSSSSTSGMLSPTPTILHSPRDLPLGRPRRSSSRVQHPLESKNESPSIRPVMAKLSDNIPVTTAGPISKPNAKAETTREPRLDVIAEIAKWRRERKAVFEAACQAQRPYNDVPFVQGYWAGEVKVVRASSRPDTSLGRGRSERTGSLDVYGNYFEGGYLYP